MTSPTPSPPAGAAALSRTERRRGRLLILAVFVVVWGLITHGTFAGSGDEPHYAMIAHSIAFDADLDLANNYRDATLIGGGTLQPEAHAIPHNGRLSPVHDIGMPLVLAPIVGAAYVSADALGDILPEATMKAARLNKALLLRHQLSLVMALLTGLLARELYLILHRIGSGQRAFGWALLFALAPPVLSHSFLFFTEIPTALITLFVFRRLCLRPIDTPAAATLLGTLAGFLLLVHARNIGIAAGLALVAVLMTRKRQLAKNLLAVFLGGIAIGVLGRSVVTYVLWGTFLTTPHAALGYLLPLSDFLREIFERGTGLLFDREYGLFAYGPIYLLAGPGLLILFKEHRQLSRAVLIVLACYLVPVLLPLTNVHGWTGGWSPAARFLVPIAPLLWIGVYLSARHATRTGTFIVAALVVTQIAVSAFLWRFPMTLWNDGDGVSAFDWTGWLPSWTTAGSALTFAVALFATAAFTYLFKYVTRSSSVRRVPLGPPGASGVR